MKGIITYKRVIREAKRAALRWNDPKNESIRKELNMQHNKRRVQEESCDETN